MDWNLLTALGSAALVWPSAIALGVMLWPSQDKPGQVLRWWLGLGTASVLVAITKLFFYAWGTGISRWDLTCFSGHAMLSAAFWPVAFAALAGGEAPRRTLGFLVGLGLAMGVAYSRVVLGAHPLSEALAGGLLGLLVGVLGLLALGDSPSFGRWSGAPSISALIAVAFLLVFDQRLPTLPTEVWLQRIAAAISGRDSPVDRLRWRAGSVRGPKRPQAGLLACDEYNNRLT